MGILRDLAIGVLRRKVRIPFLFGFMLEGQQKKVEGEKDQLSHYGRPLENPYKLRQNELSHGDHESSTPRSRAYPTAGSYVRGLARRVTGRPVGTTPHRHTLIDVNLVLR